MALVLGLGNPGSRYALTRHNAGWRVVAALVERWRAAEGEGAETYRFWRAERPLGPVDLVTPLTFMNASGEALAEWRALHEFDPEQMLVVADDVYLPLGAIRVRARGSSGGHLGLESIERELGGREFPRLRVGVGETESAGLREHVLEELEGDERQAFEDVVRLAADAVELWASEGVLAAMNTFNRRAGKEVSES